MARPKELEVVVAWYTEDLSWIPPAADPAVTVYSKNGGLGVAPGERAWRVSQLPNVGREGHTYLRHIVDHYDDLADVTVFLQGDARPHSSPDVGSAVAALRSRDVQWFLNLGTDRVVTMTDFKCPHWTERGRDVTAAMYAELFVSAAPRQVAFGAGALFAVTRAAVRFRSLAFWRRCLQYLEGGVDPVEGYAMERLWPLLFEPGLRARL
jgi:hypothetical protein